MHAAHVHDASTSQALAQLQATTRGAHRLCAAMKCNRSGVLNMHMDAPASTLQVESRQLAHCAQHCCSASHTDSCNRQASDTLLRGAGGRAEDDAASGGCPGPRRPRRQGPPRRAGDPLARRARRERRHLCGPLPCAPCWSVLAGVVTAGCWRRCGVAAAGGCALVCTGGWSALKLGRPCCWRRFPFHHVGEGQSEPGSFTHPTFKAPHMLHIAHQGACCVQPGS